MATTSYSTTAMYGPPVIPTTPSKAINNMLQTKCGKRFNMRVQFLVASIICNVFNIITKIYDQIQKDKNKPSQRMWMVSCGVVGLAIVLVTVLGYNIIVGSAFLVHAMLYYVCIAVGLAGTCLCVSGIIFFDKEGAKEDFTKEQ